MRIFLLNHLDSKREAVNFALKLSATSADFDVTASLYRTCRRRGETVRRMVDCLIGAIAVRAGVPVLHADSDFDVLARHTDLDIHPVPG